LNEFMEASWRVNNKKKRNIPGKMMVLLLKKRKNICFTNKIHKRPAIVVNDSFLLGLFSSFFFNSKPSILLPLFNFSLFFPPSFSPLFVCLEVAFYRSIAILLWKKTITDSMKTESLKIVLINLEWKHA
jgi:hypothetical protein